MYICPVRYASRKLPKRRLFNCLLVKAVQFFFCIFQSHDAASQSDLWMPFLIHPSPKGNMCIHDICCQKTMAGTVRTIGQDICCVGGNGPEISLFCTNSSHIFRRFYGPDRLFRSGRQPFHQPAELLGHQGTYLLGAARPLETAF